MSRSAPRFALPVSLLLLSAVPALAHNGAVAIAVPVEGIKVDGDLSDWPDGLARYPIQRVYGSAPVQGEANLQGFFRIGYSEKANALYIAVDADDQSVVVDTSAAAPWDAQDGCEVYVDVAHGRESVPVAQYSVRGEAPRVFGEGARLSDFAAAVQRDTRGHRYEFRIDVGRRIGTGMRLREGRSIGVDVVLCDRDEDDSFSWVAWGPGTPKYAASTRVGDVVLAAEAMGTVSGRTSWASGPPVTRALIRAQALDHEELWVHMLTDGEGEFAAVLPPGRYALQAMLGQGETEGVVVRPGESTQAALLVHVRRGVAVKAGPGRTVPVGSGHQDGVWRTLTARDGLPSATVTSMAQGRDGRLWLASGWLGWIARYDGQAFTVYTEEDGAPGTDVRCLLEDQSGDLWFGLPGDGLVRFDGKTFTTYTTRDGLPDDDVTALLESGGGHLWIGTTSGIARYDGESFVLLRHEDGLPPGEVLGLLEDGDGNLWISTAGGGVSRYDGDDFTTFTTEDGLGSNTVACMAESGSGHLWFGTGYWARPGAGVSRYDGSGFTTFDTTDGLAGNRIWSVCHDREGQLWLGTDYGVSRYDGRAFDSYTSADGLGHNSVRCILEDSEGHVWFGTWGGGVTRYDGRQLAIFTGFGRSDGVTDVAQDRDGDLWFGDVRGGVTRYDGLRFEPVDTEALTDSPVHDILVDSRGDVWVATWGAGVLRYDGVAFHRLPGVPSRHPLAVLEDRHGNLWFGTYQGGVSRYDGERLETFTAADGLASNIVAAMLEDREGTLWFGGEGVSRYDGEGFTSVTQSLTITGSGAMLEDQAGNIWLGGEGVIVRYDEGQLERFDVPGMVTAILEDAATRLWVGTWGGGVVRADGTVFQDLTRRDGLPSDTINDLFEDAEGNIWIATSDGIVRYRPQRASPPVALTDVVLDRRHGPVGEVSMASSQELVAFEFSSRSLATAPGQMLYLHRLVGYDETWGQTRQRRVEYHDLPRGEYTFEVKAVDRDLNYSEKPATVSLTVHWPYERIAWVSALALAALGLIWQGGRVVQRDRRLQEATRQKSEFLSRMSHDLRTPMNAIIGYTRILLRRTKDVLEERQYRNLENIQTSSDNLLSLINEILDLSRIEAGRIDLQTESVDLGQLIGDCVTSVAPLVKPGVELVQDVGDVPAVNTDADRIRRVVMNLLGNAVKFTQEGSITISLKPEDSGVKLSVADTGVGIPAEDLPGIFAEYRQVERRVGEKTEGTGLGLAIAAKSVEMLGGTISAESEIGKGTTFTVRIGD